ncbi:DUF6719 family protein [Rhizobium sp. S152]|uniref:DUF6719 family protein n=1 Tax=Rhizobium sp. S152 TaxID=3055038 RepID=UPI003014A83D
MLSLVDISGASAQTPVVTTPPTLKTLTPGQSVLFDDKKCPAGQIGKYTRAQKRSSITRRCVHR